MKENIKLLSFFQGLDKPALEKLYSISVLNSYPSGYTLYYEEDVQEKIFFLVEGLLKTYKVDRQDNEIFLNYVYNDSLISEITSVSEDELTCFSNTEFIKDSIVLEINFAEFKKYFIDTNILTTPFISEILLKSKQLYCIIDREVVYDAMAKVAYSLYDDLNVFNKLKRQEIASMLHIQPATLSRVLKKLLRQNIIEIEATRISILDKDRLKKIFSGATYD